MIYVANPIYDSVFKYLMEDERVAKTLLKGQKNNRLERLLDIFCQDRKEEDNSQILRIDENMMDDEEMRRIVTRLLSAASDTQVRHSMNIEEEINTALENRDTEIMQYKKEASDAKKVIAEQTEQLSKQTEQLSKQTEQLATAIHILQLTGMEQKAIASSLGLSDEEYRQLVTKRLF